MRPFYFFLAVISTIIIGNSIIIFAEPDSKIIYSSWTLIINSLIAAGLSTLILLRDKNRSDKTSIYLTIGLVFWFLANIIWGYYEIVLDIVSPVPSLADLFLLSAYGFLIYRLILIFKKIDRTANKKILFLTIGGTGIFLIYIINLMLSLTEISTFRGLMLFIVTMAYPILNSILTVFAVLILLDIRKEKHHFIPWICELIGLLAIVIGDSWFAIIVLTAFVEQLWISALLLSSHYLLIAGGLFWYLRYQVNWKSNIFKDNFLVIQKYKIIKKKVFILSISACVALISTILYFVIYSTVNYDGNILIADKNWNVLKSITNSTDKNIIIGAILPFTGSFSSIGKSVKAALENAELDVDEFFKESNSSFQYTLFMANSKSSPIDSLNAIKKLHEMGAKIIVGPATSTAVSAVLDYANKNNIILISYSSTSPLLAIKGDNLYRIVPDDLNQGKVIAEKMKKEGIKIIIPFYRGDIYGNGLYNATKSNFERLGGKVEEGVSYKPHTGKFATSLHRINFILWNQELKKLNEIVTKDIKEYGINAVAVYVIAFDEITPILIQAPLFDNLAKVKWYGSDSIAQNHQITKNNEAAIFSIETNLTNPLYGINSTTEKFKELKQAIEKEDHESTSLTYPFLAYDSYWIAALSLDKNNTENNTENVESSNNSKQFRDIVKNTIESYNGISGKINLNDAGDRVSDNYDFWVITKNNKTNHFEWEKEHLESIDKHLISNATTILH